MENGQGLTRFPQWQVFGHDWAINFLSKSMRHGRTRHAYLITGSSGIGKSTLAYRFAQALNCTADTSDARPCGVCRSCRLMRSGNHPDILQAQADERSGSIRIDAVRELLRQIALKPYDSRYRVALLPSFEQVQPRVQDALLKTLEEPPPHAVLIVLAQTPDSVLPTIKSRCQHIPLRPAPLETVEAVLLAQGATAADARLLARLSSGRVGWALEALANPDVLAERQNLLDMLVRAIEGNRAQRFEVAEAFAEVATKDRDAGRYGLEMWQTFWRDVLLATHQSSVKPCNSDHLPTIQKLASRISSQDAKRALLVTRTTLYQTFNTNASLRLALEAMLLDYPFV